MLVDSDIFVDHLRGSSAFRRTRGDSVAYSVVTRCELFAGRATQEEAATTLLGPYRELGVGRAIAERAGRIRRETGLHVPDAIIAATALEHDLELVTRNVRDFRKVEGLRVRAP